MQLDLQTRLAAPVLDVEIGGIRVHELRFNIAPPLRLPAGAVHAREYVVLEIDLATGITGTAYVLTRGAPIYDAATKLAAGITGKPLRSAITHSASQRGGFPIQRAHALADICAWDLAGKDVAVPTWRLIATAASKRKALAVAGYRRHEETSTQLASRLARLGQAGITAVKIADGTGPETQDALKALRSSNDGEHLAVVVDMGFAAGTVDDARASVEAWQQFRLDWVEDPFPSADASALAELRRGSRAHTLFGAGDEAPPSDLLRMLELDAVDVLRLDATTTGGITGLLNLAAQTTCRMSFHIYPEIHRHIACVLSQVKEIELFLPEDPFDFVDRFITADAIEIDAGYLAPPQQPGLGLAFDPRAVESAITRSTTFVDA